VDAGRWWLGFRSFAGAPSGDKACMKEDGE